MANIVVALIAGVMFGTGLSLSGMINPAKVLGFLDIFGDWDPSLMLVMAGAIPVAALGFAVSKRLSKPVVSGQFNMPERAKIDGALIAGSMMFGLGWGLVGLCPGPALTDLSFGQTNGVIFVAAMVAGMKIYAWWKA